MSRALGDLDALAGSSKSVFPGRVLLRRKKAHEIVDRMSDQLRAVGESTNVPAFESFKRAANALAAFDALASGATAGPSTWRIWFADVSRKRLREAMDELHAAFAPFV
jgi:hypothetical protein